MIKIYTFLAAICVCFSCICAASDKQIDVSAVKLIYPDSGGLEINVTIKNVSKHSFIVRVKGDGQEVFIFQGDVKVMLERPTWDKEGFEFSEAVNLVSYKKPPRFEFKSGEEKKIKVHFPIALSREKQWFKDIKSVKVYFRIYMIPDKTGVEVLVYHGKV